MSRHTRKQRTRHPKHGAHRNHQNVRERQIWKAAARGAERTARRLEERLASLMLPEDDE